MISPSYSYRLLIYHPCFSKHIRRFIRRLKQYNKEAQIDFLTICNPDEEIPSDIAENTNRILYIKLVGPEECENRYLRFIRNYLSIRKQIRALSKRSCYDIINVHYPDIYMAFGAKHYKKMCKNLLITPWGSDVYQLNSLEKYFIGKLYDNADNVTGIGNKFTRDFQKLFAVPDNKIINLTLASETVEYFKSHKDSLTKDEAKEKLGIKDYYGIVCGYNGNPRSNHYQMFEAIKRIKDNIPEPIVILVQITYGYTEEYLQQLKDYIKANDLKAIFFDKYMDFEDLYCLMTAADMFVFVAVSDSNSGVLKEYIYLGKKVILGEWLKYDDLLNCSELPYYPTKSLDTIGETIKEAYFSKPRTVDPEWIKNFESAGYDYWMPKWDEFYSSCVKK